MRRNLRRLGAVALGLVLAVGVTTGPAQAESNGGVRIMPLGDSITDGWNVPGAYRTGLWQRLGKRAQIDFVGAQANGPANLGDHDHEGHPGWRIDELDWNIVGWLRAAAPRTVLLHIGTNDVNQDYDLANAPARLGALIDKIRTNAPAVEIFVAQLTPESDPVREARIQAFNAAVPGIVAQRGPKTHLVDMHTGFTNADLADGVHPTAAGYDKMAARWYSALRSVPRSLTQLTTPPVDTTVLMANPQSARCMDVAGASTTPGGSVLIWDCSGSANQRWTRSAAGELRVYGDLCLDSDGTATGAKVRIWTCTEAKSQKFTFKTDGTVVGASSRKCVEVVGNGTDNGTAIQLNDCNGSAAQRWSAR